MKTLFSINKCYYIGRKMFKCVITFQNRQGQGQTLQFIGSSKADCLKCALNWYYEYINKAFIYEAINKDICK